MRPIDIQTPNTIAFCHFVTPRIDPLATDVMRPIDLNSPSAIDVCHFVKTRIDQIDTDVFLIEEALLLGLFRPVTAVVQHDIDQWNAPAYRGVNLLRGIHKTAIALQTD